MRLSEKLNEMLCNQVVHELANSHIYMQMGIYFENLQLKNLAKYFRDNATHERAHAELFIKHLTDRIGGDCKIGDVPKPYTTFSSIQDLAKIYFEREQLTTEKIEEIYGVAMNSGSFVDLPFISNMLNEQVEEEDTANQFLMNVSMVKDIVLFDLNFGK